MELNEIADKFEQNGFRLLKVGGCVRDKFLRRQNHDVDLVTDATPDQVKSMFQTIDLGGSQFGITVIHTDAEDFEVATFRADSKSSDGRHPDSIKFASITEDACRRDLTINALFEDFQCNVVDPTGKGLSDIKNKVIRFCTSESDEVQGSLARIAEDHLRVLRAIRFMATLEGFVLAPSALEAVTLASKDSEVLAPLSKERLAQEFGKLLAGKGAVKALHLMNNLGLLQKMFPEVDTEKAVMTVSNCHSVESRLACFVSASSNLSLTLKNLRVSKEVASCLTEAVETGKKLATVSTMAKTSAWSMLQSNNFRAGLHVALAVHGFAVVHSQLAKVQNMVKNPMPAPLVTGKELLALGMKPSAQFKTTLNSLLELQLSKGLTKSQLLATL